MNSTISPIKVVCGFGVSNHYFRFTIKFSVYKTAQIRCQLSFKYVLFLSLYEMKSGESVPGKTSHTLNIIVTLCDKAAQLAKVLTELICHQNAND